MQQLGQEVRLIDYVEDSGQALAWYAKQLKEGERAEYNYGTHFLPHDAVARSLETGRSREETLRRMGLKTVILNKHNLMDGINASRVLLPKCWFDAKKCSRGIKALQNYEKKWDAKNKSWSDRPRHNWASHGADAFRYLALGLRDWDRMQNKKIPLQADTDYNIFDY